MEMVKAGTAIPAVKQISETLGIDIDDTIPPLPPGGGSKPGQTTGQPKKEEDRRAYELQERNNKWWRPLTQNENPKVLHDIESFLDEKQESFKVELETEILDKQIVQVSKKVEKHLDRDLPYILGDLGNAWRDLPSCFS